MLLVLHRPSKPTNFQAQCTELQHVTLLIFVLVCMMTASERALSDASILQRIMGCAGPGSWIFFSPVSKLWKQCYEQVDAAALQKVYPGATIHMTAYEAAFSSPSCIQLACEHGLQALFSTRMLQCQAGAYAGVCTLLAAQELGLQATDTYMEAAAACGRLPVLQLLHSAQGRQLPPEVSNQAAACAQMHVLSWLAEIGANFDTKVLTVAAQCGHVHVLQFLYEHGCVGDERTAAAAAFHGKLKALRVLRSHGCPWADDISSYAAAGGSVSLMRWLREQGVAVNALTMAHAASYGKRRLCKYLRAEGCAWDDRATSAACRDGHIATLQWLLEQGCSHNEQACCVLAAMNGHIFILAYLQSLGWLESADVLIPALYVAGAFHHLAAAQWLRRQGADWPAVLRYHDKPWSAEVLAWARAEGCTSPTED